MTTPRPRGRPRTKPLPPAKRAPTPLGSFPVGHVVSSATQRRRILLSKLAAHVPTVPTMPVIAAREISDSDLGLTGGDIAQEKAERFLRAAAAFAAQQAEKAQTDKSPFQAVEVEVPNDAMVLVPALPDDPVERGILKELRRLTGLPPLPELAG